MFSKKGLTIFAFLFVSNFLFGQILSFDLWKTYHVDGEVPVNVEESAYFAGAAPIGDIDKDGVDDIAFCAPGLGEGTSGEIFIGLMNLNGSIKSTTLIGQGKGGFTGSFQSVSSFGLSVDSLGDLDDDGVNDIIVGAYQDWPDGHGTYSGSVFILFLNTDGTVKAHQQISKLEGGLGQVGDGDKFGVEVASAGDLDNDGNMDVFVTSYENQDVGVDMGLVFILYLNDDGTVKDYKKILPTSDKFPGITYPNAGFGDGLTNIGDIDGNGMPDLIIGTKEDKFWITLLNTDGTVKSAKRIDSTHPVVGHLSVSGSLLGRAMSTIPDLNYDGVNELLVSASKGPNGDNIGEVYVMFINESGDVYDYQTINNSSVDDMNIQPGFNFATVIYHLGDINNDGYPEVAIGESWNETVITKGGAVHIITLKPKACEIGECVWPGDANNDEMVDSKDLINVCAAYGQTGGTKRILPNTRWVEQTCTDWGSTLLNTDFKHADATGDGNINFNDINIIRANYSQIVLRSSSNIATDPNGPPLYVIASQDTLRNDPDSVTFDIYLGDLSTQAQNVYGISMKWRHNVSEIFGSTNTADFTSSWLGTDGVDMIAQYYEMTDGIDIGMGRIDQTNRTGYGYLTSVKVVLPDNLGELNREFELNLTELVIVSFQGDTIRPYLVSTDTVYLLTGQQEQTVDLDQVNIYPNPTSGTITVASNQQLSSIHVYDLLGQLVLEINNPQPNVQIDLSNFHRGIYTLVATEGEKRTIQQIIRL